MSRIEISQQENSVLLNNIPIVSGGPLDTQTLVYDESVKQWIFANASPGNTGPAGPTGPSIVGPVGPTGRSGGPIGPTGSTGSTGISSSLVGATGPTGMTGAAGASSVNGATGPVGPTGSSALSAGDVHFNAAPQTFSVIKERVAFDVSSYQFNLDGNCSYDAISKIWSIKGGKAFLCTAILGNAFVPSGTSIVNVSLSWVHTAGGAERIYYDGNINISNDKKLCYVVTSVIDTSTGPRNIALEIEYVIGSSAVTIGAAQNIGGAIGYITEL